MNSISPNLNLMIKASEKASKILSRFKINSRSSEGGIEKVKKYYG